MLIRMNFHHRKLSKWSFGFIPLDGAKKILDIGCGGGKNIQAFLKKVPLAKVYGIDYSPTSVSYSNWVNRREVKKGRADIIEGNVLEMPYEDQSFDVITAFETVYFWQPIDKALLEIYRVLKPGGHFIVACEVNNPIKFTNLTKRIMGMTVYSPHEMENLLKNFEFTSIETHIKNDFMCLICSK